MKEELLQLRNQLRMGHRISFAEAMLLQRAIDILVNKAGNSPVIGIDLASGPDRTVEVHYVAPPGYVMVPKEPTAEMQSAGASAIRIETTGLNKLWTGNAVFRAMLAAAPQSPVSEPATVPGSWIPVSERMPENDGVYLCWDNRYVTTYAFIFGRWQANQFIAKNITHWMPLPNPPRRR